MTVAPSPRSQAPQNPRWFVRGDIDGFFGLFIDNLIQLMLIVELSGIVGLPEELITRRILPGAALSILLGNVFYSWQAHRLAQTSGRDDVTALPYGINTVSLLAYVFFVIAPVLRQTGDPVLAWQAGLFACLASAAFEIAGAFVGDWFRRNTPRAALLSALAGIAITFISMGFVFQIFNSPTIAILPMMLILISYASRIRLPFGLPGGFVAVALGTGLAWLFRALGLVDVAASPTAVSWGLSLPKPVPGDFVAFLSDPRKWAFLSVIVPMGLFNVIGSLQNLESAEAAGDRYETRSSLLANGVGSLVAALFGSPFPTTIYIGHPAWKAMGARIGYSVADGVVITALCLVGGVSVVLRLIPLEVTLGILLWIGIMIGAQAFQAVPGRHALAVMLGLVPSLAAWALVLIETSLRVAGTSLLDAAPRFGKDLYIHGVIALSQGFLITAMIFAAVLVFVIEHRFLAASAWTFAGAVLSNLGIIHAYVLTPSGVQNDLGLNAAPEFSLAYLGVTALLLGLHWFGAAPADPVPGEPGEERPDA